MKKKIIACIVAASALTAVSVCSGFKIGQPKSEENKYCGAYTYTDHSETVNYAKKETVSYSIKGDLPNYLDFNSQTSCGNVGGAVVIGYYDRLYEELIPNYKTYTKIGSVIKYTAGGSEVADVMLKLHTLMGTDVGSAGTTYEGFQNGMKAYVESCNYSYSINNLGTLDINKYKTEVELNRPVVVFLNNFSMAVQGEDNGATEVIKSVRSYSPHIVVGCGYKIDTYYNSNGQVTATRTYLKVASGLNRFGIGYLCLDGKSKIDIATSAIIQ